MVRIVLAVLLWVVVIGGLAVFQHQRQPAPVAVKPQEMRDLVKADCYLEVTADFDLEPDPFALTVGETEKSAGLVIKGSGHVLFSSPTVRAGVPVRLGPLQGLIAGLNEFYLEAAPPIEAAASGRVVQVRLICGNRTESEHKFVSDGSGKVTGVFRTDLSAVAGRTK